MDVPLSGGDEQVARVSPAVYEEVVKHQWTAQKQGRVIYARGNVKGKGPVSLHRFVYALLIKKGLRPVPSPEQTHIDHIDSDGLNNTTENLQAVTPSVNAQKMRKRLTQSSVSCQYRGVHKDKFSGRYSACFKGAYLGSSGDPYIAACYYDHAAVREGLGYATNFPQLDHAHPLTQKAKDNIAKQERRTLAKQAHYRRSNRVCVGIQKREDKFACTAKGRCVGTFPTKKEAVLFRDVALKQGVACAKELAVSVYCQPQPGYGYGVVHLDRGFRARYQHTEIGCYQTEDEAVIFNDMARTEGLKCAHELDASIYY